MSRYKDIAGERFGHLVAVKYAYTDDGKAYWHCRCDCGTEYVVLGTNLRAGRIKSCGCLGMKPWEATRNAYWNRYLQGAATRGFSWDLTKEEFTAIAEQPCHYCNAEPEPRTDSMVRGEWTANGIDRVDSDRGYSTDNCVPCCSRCNYMKRDMPVREFLQQCRRIAKENKEDKCLN